MNDSDTPLLPLILLSEKEDSSRYSASYLRASQESLSAVAVNAVETDEKNDRREEWLVWRCACWSCPAVCGYPGFGLLICLFLVGDTIRLEEGWGRTDQKIPRCCCCLPCILLEVIICQSRIVMLSYSLISVDIRVHIPTWCDS